MSNLSSVCLTGPISIGSVVSVALQVFPETGSSGRDKAHAIRVQSVPRVKDDHFLHAVEGSLTLPQFSGNMAYLNCYALLTILYPFQRVSAFALICKSIRELTKPPLFLCLCNFFQEILVRRIKAFQITKLD